MKKLKLLAFTLLTASLFVGCSGDDSSSDVNDQEQQGAPMTAKFNGQLKDMYNPFGTNESTPSIFTDYPDEDFITLKGRPTDNYFNEINMYIKRTDLHVGSYDFVYEDYNNSTTFIIWIDNSNGDIYEHTKNGNVTITEINTETKFVKGTFNLDVVDLWSTTPDVVHTSITEGTFAYYYDVED